VKTLIALGLLLVAMPASAQTAAISDVVLHVTRPADTTFVQRDLVIPWANVNCNQTPLAAPMLPWINMVRFDFDDPARLTTRDCRLTAAGLALSAAFFAALPTNTGYYATITYRSSEGESGPSNSSGPFQRSAGTPCGTNLAGRQWSVLLSIGNVTGCAEPR
jgi:hypothetical protein